MKSLNKKSLLILIAIVCFAFTTTAQTKIAYVNSQEIITQMPAYTQGVTAMQALNKKMSDDLKAKESTLRAYVADITKKIQAGKLSELDQQAESKKVEQMQIDLQKEEQKAREDLLKREQAINEPILKAFNDALNKVCKEQGYTYILDRNTILAMNNGFDANAQVKAVLGIK